MNKRLINIRALREKKMTELELRLAEELELMREAFVNRGHTDKCKQNVHSSKCTCDSKAFYWAVKLQRDLETTK